jgi:hypothetical protein
MSLCDYLIVEEGTRKVSLIGCFSALTAAEFPKPPRLFFVHADLTDGTGEGTAELVITYAQTGEEVYRHAKSVRFADRLRVVLYGWKVTNCSFPHPGRYTVSLLVDGQWVTQRTLGLIPAGGPS